MRKKVEFLRLREAQELRVLGVEDGINDPPPTEEELEKEFCRPDLDAAQDIREAEFPDDPHYIEMGVIQ